MESLGFILGVGVCFGCAVVVVVGFLGFFRICLGGLEV